MKRDSFEKWLKDNTDLADGTIKSYSSAIAAISDWAIKQNIIQQDIYEIEDSTVLNEICSFLDSSELYAEKNIIGNRRWSSALTLYKQFISGDILMDGKMDTIEKIKKTCDKLLNDGKLLTIEQLKQGYALFTEKFSPEKLKNLDGELLINTIFNIGNKDGLAYWLEFKNDDEFKTSLNSYGSIAGGSSFKYIMFKRNLDSKWVTGNPQNPTILTVDEAIVLGRKLRDALVAGAELIDKLSEDADIDSYINLQEQLGSILINNMHSLGWVHKYYHMIYPNKIDAYHTTRWQKHALIHCNIKPVQDDKLYIMSGQLIQVIKQTELPSSYVMVSMCDLFGSPVNYFRIGTTGDDKSYWDEMRKGGYVAIGWSKIGDLREYVEQDKSKLKTKLVNRLKQEYPNNPSVIGKSANQILSFYFNINQQDIVVAVNGEKVLGVGQVTGNYEYIEGLDYPHTIKTDWIYIADTRLPNPREGILTTVYQYKEADNILEIEKLSNTLFIDVEDNNTEVIPLTSLTGINLQIENTLTRKKQLILYGPPGTGKTYHAEKACFELAARNHFNKSFANLTTNEKIQICGDENNKGAVRICCFHPSYGYEDFIEGIKPSVVNGQTVFEPEDGIFKELCIYAAKEPQKKFYLIIDEINRGDISRIFGELIMLIEAGKRGKTLVLPLSKKGFKVPENVYIVGTMNTADRSIALLDVALRRRFGFIELMPEYGFFEGVVFDGLPLDSWLKELNRRICENIGKDARNLQIGHSYFLEKEKPVVDNEKFKKIIKEDIIPLIEEYCYGDYSLMAKVLGEGLVDTKNQLVKYELFASSDISDLINALLTPCPELRAAIEDELVENENTDEENGNGDVQ